jgi:iron-sulfur cluster repair protein YtfE (RIC family)
MTSIVPASTIDPTWTINETVARFPSTLPVFDAAGLDSCCGGGHAIAEAARRHGLGLESLLQALNAVIAP